MQDLLLDVQIRNWVLFPIMIVMILVGLLRHYLTLLGNIKKPKPGQMKEANALMRSRLLRSMEPGIMEEHAFECRKRHLIEAFQRGDYLAKPPKRNPDGSIVNAPPDPMANMDVMMDGMKKQFSQIIPQTILMSWISFFFTGFALSNLVLIHEIVQLPVQLTVRFKAMTQRDIMTSELDASWVSALSWYFLNLFGSQAILTLIIGNSAQGGNGMQMEMMPAQVDPIQVFKGEQETLSLTEYPFKDPVEHILSMYGK